jgi:CheY-like chemotaxis protein
MTKALVVDDDGPNRMLLTEVLEMAGFSVLSAENGRSGLKMVEEHRPSLVLLDMKMPEMNGTEFLSQLEDSGLLSRTPVVVVSADRKTTPPSAAAVIRKPFAVSDLLEAVERLSGAEPPRQ